MADPEEPETANATSPVGDDFDHRPVSTLSSPPNPSFQLQEVESASVDQMPHGATVDARRNA